MRSFKKFKRDALYVLLPLLFFAIVQLLFAYGTWEINPKNWSPEVRFGSSLLGLMSAALSELIAYNINKPK